MFDRAVINNLTGNNEATMNYAVSASVGMALLKLLTHYGVDNLALHYRQAFEEISENPLASVETLQFLKAKVKEGFNVDLDTITLFIAQEADGERATIDFSDFSLKQVVWLVWSALTDDEKYRPLVESINEQLIKHAEKGTEIQLETLESHRQSRLESFFNCLERLRRHPVCHLGIRHELVFLINQSFPGIELIEDEKSALLLIVKDLVFSQYLSVYEKASNTEKQALQQAVVKWMRTASCEELCDLLDCKPLILQKLNTFYLGHGINPKNMDLTLHLEDALKALVFSCDALKHPGAYTSYLVFKDCKVAQDPTAKAALKAVKGLIKDQINLNDVDFIAAIKLFHQLYQTFQQVFAEKARLVYAGKLPENYAATLQAVSEYFTVIAETKSLPLCFEALEAINSLKTALDEAKKDNFFDQIENFFWKWFDGIKTDNMDLMRAQYTLFLNPAFQENVLVTDSYLEALRMSEKEGVLDLNPYDINRILLTAILVKPAEWSAQFAGEMADNGEVTGGFLGAVIDFIQNHFNTDANLLTDGLKASYPQKLLKQLAYLRALHQESLQAPGFVLVNPPLFLKKSLLLPARIKTAKDWFFIAELMEPGKRDAIYRQYSILINRILYKAIENQNDRGVFLFDCLQNLPDTAHASFLLSRDMPLQLIVTSSRELTRIVKRLPTDHWKSFVACLGKDRCKALLENVPTSWLLLNNFPHDQWNCFLEATNYIAIRFFKDTNALGRLLRDFHSDSFQYFLNLPCLDLKALIPDGTVLANILAKLPWHKQKYLTEYLIELCHQPIHHAEQLLLCLKEIDEAYLREFLEILQLQQNCLDMEPEVLGRILDIIPHTGWGALFHSLKLDLNKIIQNSAQVSKVLTMLHFSKRLAFLRELKLDQIQMVETGNELCSLLALIPLQESALFLIKSGVKIKPHFTQGKDLGLFLTLTPVRTWQQILEKTGFNPAFLFENNCEELAQFLKALPEWPLSIYEEGIKAILGRRDNYLTTVEQFAGFLKKIPIRDWYFMVRNLQPGFKLIDANQLFSLITHFPLEQRIHLLQSLAIKANYRITNTHQLKKVLELLPKEEWLNYVSGASVLSFLQNEKALFTVLDLFPVDKWPDILKNVTVYENVPKPEKLGSLLGRMSKDKWKTFVKKSNSSLDMLLFFSSDLVPCLEKLPEFQRIYFLEIFHEQLKRHFKTSWGLIPVLATLPEIDRERFAASLDLNKSIRKGMDLGLLLNTVPVNNWARFLKTSGLNLPFLLEDSEEFGKLLITIPENTWELFIRASAVNYQKFINNEKHLLQVLKPLSQTQRKFFIQTFQPFAHYEKSEIAASCLSLGFYVLLKECLGSSKDANEFDLALAAKTVLITLLFLGTGTLAGLIAGTVVLARECDKDANRFFSPAKEKPETSTGISIRQSY